MELDHKAIGKRMKIARISADLAQDRLGGKVEIDFRALSGSSAE